MAQAHEMTLDENNLVEELAEVSLKLQETAKQKQVLKDALIYVTHELAALSMPLRTGHRTPAQTADRLTALNAYVNAMILKGDCLS